MCHKVFNVTFKIKVRQNMKPILLCSKNLVATFPSSLSLSHSAARDPIKRFCRVRVTRTAAPVVTSGLIDIKLMKTTQSGFAGYIEVGKKVSLFLFLPL